METARSIADQLYKQLFGKMVRGLVCVSRDISLEMAEDIVQDTFSTALLEWEAKGIPLNPSGWIYKVCRNKALNTIKKNKRIPELSTTDDIELETKFSESILGDRQLQLLFACAHPSLAPKVQVVVTLKYVINLRVAAIANVLAMSIDGVDKLLVRARQKIRDEKMLLSEPDPALLRFRLPVVHKVLYLIFNEGYKSSWGKEIMREELCEEALIMCKVLIESGVGNKETAALYALMLFNAARFDARFGASGELLDLEMQDRSRWNHELISLGIQSLRQAEDETISNYHIEASIAWYHCSAANFAATQWSSIAGLYVQLLRDNPNPFAELSYAVALFYSGNKAAAFEILERLHKHPFLCQYSLLNATLGKLHGLEGRKQMAMKFLHVAKAQSNFEEEKKLLGKMIERIQVGSLRREE